MTPEYEVAKQLFEMSIEMLPKKHRLIQYSFDELPDSAKTQWFKKATKVINTIEQYCPFSPKYDIVKVRS